MEFRFTDQQQMIRTTAQDFLAEVSDSAAVRAAMATERGYDPQLWQRICREMCWQALPIPTAQGGLGLGYVELAIILEQMGRYLLCSPFFATLCLAGNAVLVAASPAQRDEYLPQLLAGKTATLAYTGSSGRWDADAVQATWRRDGAAYVLDGDWRYVPDGHTAELLIVAARAARSTGAAGISLFALPAASAGVQRQWLPSLDQTRKQAAISCRAVRVSAGARLGAAEEGAAGPDLAQIIDLATIALAAEQLGGSQQALDSSVAYTGERVQFQRRIASYQAIKHRAADMMVRLEAARSAVYYAACIAQRAWAGEESAPQLAEAASIAKAWCSDTYFFNAGSGIQLHGGVGFTWEYDIQLYFKRAQSSRILFGDSAWHRERLAQQLLG